jgi:GTP-binding protein
VAIVGRPNVGKSTLFNRLVGARQAIVEDIAGTTRDRLYGEAEWKDQAFIVVDTGGLEPKAEEGYSALIREQVEMALAEADAVHSS